jgi:hypothetical protein
MNLDGINPDYLETSELVRPGDVKNKIVSLKRGSFYGVGLRITDVLTGDVVTIGHPTAIDVDASTRSPKVVYEHLKFPDGLTTDVYVTYYYVDATVTDGLTNLVGQISALGDAREGLDYKFIKGTSTTANVAPHVHDASVLYKTEKIIAALMAVFKHNSGGVEDVLDSVLANYQPNTDNRLITIDKTIVGAINELLVDTAAVDLGAYQKASDTNLITQAQRLSDAINELHSRVTTLSAGGLGSLNMMGELVGSGIIDLNSQMNNESKVWVVNASVSLKGDFGGGVSTANVGLGDVVYYDAETGKLFVQESGSAADDKLDMSPAGLPSGYTTVGDAVGAVYKTISSLSGLDATNKLFGLLVNTIDLTNTAQTGNGYYVVAKDGVSVKANFGVVETRLLNVGEVLNYSHATTRYSVGVGTAPGLNSVTTAFNMMEEHYRFIDGLNYVYDRIMSKVGSDSDAIESMGSISTNTDLTSLEGSESYIIYNACSITAKFHGETEVTTKAVYGGDVLYRKRSEGVIYLNSVGNTVAKYLDATPTNLNGGGTIVQSLTELDAMIKGLTGSGNLISIPTTLTAPPTLTTRYVTAVDGVVVTAPFDDGSTSKTLVAGKVLVSNVGGTKWVVGDIKDYGVDKLGMFSSLLPSPNKNLVDAINELKTSSTGKVTAETGTLIKTTGEFSNDYALLCNGSLHKMSDYPALGELVGASYGGDGIATFAIPDAKTLIGLADGPILFEDSIKPPPAAEWRGNQRGGGIAVTRGLKRILVIPVWTIDKLMLLIDTVTGSSVTFTINELSKSNAINGRLHQITPVVIGDTDELFIAVHEGETVARIIRLDLSGSDVMNPVVTPNDPRFIYTDTVFTDGTKSIFLRSIYYHPVMDTLFLSTATFNSNPGVKIYKAVYNRSSKLLGGIVAATSELAGEYRLTSTTINSAGEMLVERVGWGDDLSWFNPLTNVFRLQAYPKDPDYQDGVTVLGSIINYGEGYLMSRLIVNATAKLKSTLRYFSSDFKLIAEYEFNPSRPPEWLVNYDGNLVIGSGGVDVGLIKYTPTIFLARLTGEKYYIKV